jgi:hypothetical protein
MNIENLIGKLFRKSEARRVANSEDPDVSRSQKVGLSPGTPVYIGAPTDAPVKIHLYSFNQESVVSRDIGLAEISGLPGEMKKEFIHWLNIDGLHDVALLQKLARPLESIRWSSRTSPTPSSAPSSSLTKTITSLSSR